MDHLETRNMEVNSIKLHPLHLKVKNSIKLLILPELILLLQEKKILYNHSISVLTKILLK
jgi:hypothetical protein